MTLTLRQQLEWLKKHHFGSGKSEKLTKGQLPLGLEETVASEVLLTSQVSSHERSARKAQLSKEKAYEHLPVEKTIIIDPDEVKKAPAAYEQIGQESSFELAIQPPRFYRIETIRRKYRLKADKSHPPLIAPAPKRPVQGIASVSLLTHILLSKYVDHLPLYRQEKMLKRYGVALSRQNMVNWVTQVAQWLKPIYNHMRKELIRGDYLQIDETPIKVLDPDSEQKKIRQGWLWPISRPGADVLFSWSITRSSEHLEKLLKGFKGYLQSDGYSAYGKYINEQEAIVPVGCMAHARRKFKEAEKEGEIPLSILKLFAQLYVVEKQLHSAHHEEVNTVRQTVSLPIMQELYQTVMAARKDVLPQSLTGKACDYTLGQWSNLKTYLDDGRLSIDNNLIENAIRPSAIGKKNWMFIGHPRAGERSAIIYSIVVSCQRHNIDVVDYLNDVLTQVPYLVNKNQSHLTPLNYSTS